MLLKNAWKSLAYWIGIPPDGSQGTHEQPLSIRPAVHQHNPMIQMKKFTGT